jgi:Tfp pilus assembly protein FimT
MNRLLGAATRMPIGTHAQRRTQTAVSMNARMLSRRRPASGFTMIEWLVTALVTVIVLVGVVAGLQGVRASKQIEGVAQNLVADLNLSRSTALGAAQSVQLITAGDGRSWRLVRCDATQGCQSAGDVFKSVSLPPEVSVTPNRTFVFSAPRALAQPAAQSACLTAGSSVAALKVGIENALGAAKVCSLGSASGSIPACSSGC